MAISGDAGKVAITPKHAYNEEIDYEILDMVTYQGNCYIAVKDVEKGNPPVIESDGEEIVDTTNWFKCTDDQTAENASAAASSATAAAESASSAATSAQTATDAISTISQYATNASNSAANAANSEASASSSANSASDSASSASQLATSASQSAMNAAKSENNAAKSASSASGYSAASATNAVNAARSEDSAEAWAAGTINGEPVGSDAEQYQKNAKYYAEQAGSAVNDYVGATDSTNGTRGLMKAPQAGEQDAFAKGDGDWCKTPLGMHVVNGQLYCKYRITVED